jgi:hypothetical protein
MLGALCMCAVAGASSGEFKLVGEGRLKVLFWSVYDSSLYTADGAYNSGQRPLRLDIKYLLNIDADDLVARTRQEWKFQNLTHPRQQQWLDRLQALWPDINAGDVLSLQIDERQHSSFFLNGESLGRLEDKDFSRQFLAIWLGQGTSQPDLRLELIGQT